MSRNQDERYHTKVRDLIIAGRARPSQIVAHRLPHAQAPDAFHTFDERIDDHSKVMLDLKR